MIRIKLNSPIPIYEQLIQQFNSLLEKGILKPGEAIPSIRSLADQLDVAINTVARAYTELERMGIIEMNGQKGSFVRSDIEISNKLSHTFKEPILSLIGQGLSQEEIVGIFHRSLKDIYR